jgi:DNA helicase-2/ATP-dependent DNA helicase PcrA
MHTHETPSSSLDSLNPAQREAVLHTQGPLLIVAGAGAGKTKTLTERIIHIIGTGVSPDAILAITFTNKAATEMKERVTKKILERHIDRMPTITTFHRLGASVIRDHAAVFGLTKHFSIADEDDTRSIVKEVMRELGIDPKILDPKRVKHIISEAKMSGRTPDSSADFITSHAESEAVRIWRGYETKLKESKSLDFDDLIVKAVRLLETNETVRQEYQARYHYIHVDEYQDTNDMEYRLVRVFAGDRRNICVVGDTDQNIYGWRGAKIKNMLNFERDFPGAHTVFLEENYRSTEIILDAANAVINKNTVRIPKKIFTQKKGGDKIVRYEAYGESDEAQFVAQEAGKLISEGVNPQEIAVLFRANFQSRVLEEAFLMAEVPYRMIGTQFFDRAEVRDVISYIRVALNRDSLADMKRTINTPKRGIGATSIAKLFSGKRSEISGKTQASITSYEKSLDAIRDASEKEIPSALIRYVLESTGLRREYESEGEQGFERVENVGELATIATRYDELPLGEGILKFLEDASLRAAQDDVSDEKEGVRLITAHASKGLEFEYVFIVGLEEGLFPHERSMRATKIEDAEEERRLFYVALTRAKKKLFLSHANMRTIFGSRNVAIPSQFLHDIPPHLVELHVAEFRQSLPSIFLD